jgi:predicted O-methyltransferase YrrM
MISKMIYPENILEIGTYTGYSSICLAKGLKPGGRLTTIEINDELKDFAHAYFVKAGVDDRIIQLTGNALSVIPSLNQMFDLVFIDGDKREYSDYYNLIKKNIRQGGFIIADNVLWGEKVTESETADPQARGIIDFNDTVKKDSSVEKIIIPLRDGLTLIRRK